MPANPLKQDPTRTTLLRKQLMGEMRKRFRGLRRDILALVDAGDAFGIRADRLAGQPAIVPTTRPQATVVRTISLDMVLNTRWRFVADDTKLDNYRAWLKEQVKAGILEVSPDNLQTPWLEPHIESAYKKGALRAYTDVRKSDIAKDRSLDFIEGGKQAFLNMAFNTPTAQSKIRLLGTRAFAQLEGVTAQMDQEMSRILAQGMAEGKGAAALARELSKNVSGLERKRALAIARTEIVHAHSEGQLDAFEIMNIEEVGVLAEWSTAGDDRVCELCAPLEGIILTIKEARGMIPRHPNCRCSWIPANVGEEVGGTVRTRAAGPGQGLEEPGTKPTGRTTGQVHAKDSIADRIRTSIKRERPKLSATEARRQSRWVGADKTITGKAKPGRAVVPKAKPKSVPKPPTPTPVPKPKSALEPKSAISSDPSLKAQPNFQDEALNMSTSKEYKWLNGKDGGLDPSREFTEGLVTGRRMGVVKDLSKQTGIPKDISLDLIEQWGRSSNDSNYTSLLSQERVAKKFGGELTDWQKGKLKSTIAKRNAAIADQERSAIERYITPFEQVDDFGKITIKEGVPFNTVEENLDAFYEAMYQNTQKTLKESGVKTVRVWRGTLGDIDPIYDDLMDAGKAVPYRGNAMESWSLSRDDAQRFAGSLKGGFIAVEVPAERVLSSSLTGIGTLFESEVVLLQGVDDAMFAAVF